MHVTRILGFAAVGALLIVAAPAQQALAATPVNPGIATTAQGNTGKLTTEVHWRHNGHWNHHHHWHHRHWGHGHGHHHHWY